MIETKSKTIQTEFVTDPEEIARSNLRREAFERNLAWFQAHAQDIYRKHRGKCICVAGQELFAANTPQEVLALAQSAHPNDQGRFTRIVPWERLDRIDAAQGHVASM